MNNEWVRFSDRSGEAVVFVSDHEDWLDILNLHETSWMLFVTLDGRASCEFGWPGKEHE